MISHVTVGSSDIGRAKAFYEKVMAPLGYARVAEGDDYFAYGETEGAPDLRPQYTENYYGAYARDPDGNELQAVCYHTE